MIKFFRRIRQQLVSQNKLSKYLIYAIGEIVLVVIGILIALQLNNWNENRKLAALEVEVLQEIVQDLKDDIASLENDVGLNLRGLNSAAIIREVLESDQAYNDSLALHFGNLDFNTTYTVKTSGFENLKNLGFQIINNDSVRRAITDLHAFEYSFLKEREVLAEQRTYGYFSPRYLPYFSRLKPTAGPVGTLQAYTPNNFEALKADLEFNKLLDFISLVKEDNYASLKLTLEDIAQTMSLINDYLDNIAPEIN